MIPIGIGGYRGEAHSTEIPTGQTPLLLSIPALEMLDGHIHMKTRKLELSALGITVALIRMRKTPHLGIDVSQFGDDDSAETQKMDLKSTRGDALVHYANDLEIVKQGYAFLETDCIEDDFDNTMSSDISLASRGVRSGDLRGELTKRRTDELTKASNTVIEQEKRTWAILKKEYTLAEKIATKGFKTTMIFEPWGGTFRVTRTGSESFGWTNSQPLDKVDGYDLLTASGEKLLFNILVDHDPVLTIIAFDCRIWSVMTNMCPTIDWESLRETAGIQVLRLVRKICIHR